ncbi:MAG: endonuclease/exonuclease/phosphatase family protein, partial [Acidobacteriota bacterium]
MRISKSLTIVATAAFLCLSPTRTAARPPSGATLEVLSFNVWHGLRSGENRKKFPGEDAQRAEDRFAYQIQEIQRLDPDVLLLQEVNPNQRQARKYATALGYDEIHKVTSCGLHLGALYKIPKNVNDGIAILAKPELQLRRVGKKRLSGNAKCTASWGFQTKESRYGLFGEIRVGGRKVLV